MYVLEATLIETNNYNCEEIVIGSKIIAVEKEQDKINEIKNKVEEIVKEYEEKLPMTKTKFEPIFDIVLSTMYIGEFSEELAEEKIEELTILLPNRE